MHYLAVTLLMATGVATDGGLDWMEHYGQAKRIAKQKQSPLLVVLEDLSNATTTFNVSVASSTPKRDALKSFTLCRIDVSTDYGKRIAEAFRAKDYPYFVMLDKSTEYITFRHAGPITPQRLDEELVAHKNIEFTKPTSAKPHRSTVYSRFPQLRSSKHCPT